MLIDNGKTLEGFPLFDDSVPDGAPRAIDIRRGDKLAGETRRRFMQRDLACEARAPLTLTACADDALQLVLGDVAPPLSYSPCAWPQAHPSRVETWRRE